MRLNRGMALIDLPPVTLPVPAGRLYAFLADLSKHGAFLEPDAQNFRGDADSHGYHLDIMGMKLGLDMVVQERTEPSKVVLRAGARKIFEQRLSFEIAPHADGCTLRISDEADIPLPMAMMGADKILRSQLERSLQRIEALAVNGTL